MSILSIECVIDNCVKASKTSKNKESKIYIYLSKKKLQKNPIDLGKL